MTGAGAKGAAVAVVSVPITSTASRPTYLPAALLASQRMMTVWAPEDRVPVSQSFCW